MQRTPARALLSRTRLALLAAAVACVGLGLLLLATPPADAAKSGGGTTTTTSRHLTLGNPTGAVTNASYERNYLINRTQYAVGYDRWLGTPIWVSWHLQASDLGSTARTDAWATDTTLPTGWYRVRYADYTNGGWDRGHMCPSADRTSSTTNNAATFIMTNILPQAGGNNSGPWARLEDYCRTLIGQGNELYIVSGREGSLGTVLGQGLVDIPASVWKVVVVLPVGKNDLTRVTTRTRVIAVSMPNADSVSGTPWSSYRVTVDSIEAATGVDIMPLVADSIEAVLEASVDTVTIP